MIWKALFSMPTVTGVIQIALGSVLLHFGAADFGAGLVGSGLATLGIYHVVPGEPTVGKPKVEVLPPK